MNQAGAQIFEIRGIPKAQKRSKSRIVKTKSGKIFSHHYDPKENIQEKENTRAQIVQQNPVFIPQGAPVIVEIVCYLPRPKGHYRSNGQLKNWAPQYCTSKPDKDNIEKAVYDAMTGVVWHDDAQVVDGRLIKYYGDVPKTVIKVVREV